MNRGRGSYSLGKLLGGKGASGFGPPWDLGCPYSDRRPSSTARTWASTFPFLCGDIPRVQVGLRERTYQMSNDRLHRLGLPNVHKYTHTGMFYMTGFHICVYIYSFRFYKTV